MVYVIQRWLAMAMLAAAAGGVWAQSGPPQEPGIYTCIDDHGRMITRDRYIAECSHKEQELRNRDGSLKRRIAPIETLDEKARRDEQHRREQRQRDRQSEAFKYDDLLRQRFPSEASHQRARESALDTTRFAIENAQARVRELEAERKKLLDEAEFYRGRHMPAPLKQKLDGNDAALAAQGDSIRNAQAERDRIDSVFERQLERLRQLWNGARPGTLGPPLQ
ncbi:MAG: hypothetical protein HS128_01895 [Ideonella sp.]|nr:hypothetical protein [Ideonella sp.]MCC7458492.1 hypothetical protein [Nitrospira sp.]